MIRSVTLAIVLVLVIPQALAASDPNAQRAREATNRGTAAYNLGAYEEAAGHYEEAYRLVQDPALLFNVGQSWRRAGRPDKALTAYRSYLRTAPEEAPNRGLVARWVRELEQPAPATRPAEPGRLRPPEPPPPEPAPPRLQLVAADPSPAPSPSVFSRWWFWTAAAVVAGGVVAGVLIARDRSPGCGPGLDYCAPVRF